MQASLEVALEQREWKIGSKTNVFDINDTGHVLANVNVYSTKNKLQQSWSMMLHLKV